MNTQLTKLFGIAVVLSLGATACVGYIGVGKNLPVAKDPMPAVAVEVCEPYRPPMEPIVPALPDLEMYREHSDAEIAEELGMRLVEVDNAFRTYVRQQQRAYTEYLERCQGKRVKVYPATP